MGNQNHVPKTTIVLPRNFDSLTKSSLPNMELLLVCLVEHMEDTRLIELTPSNKFKLSS